MGKQPLGHEAGWAHAPREGTLSQSLVAVTPFLVTSPQGRSFH